MIPLFDAHCDTLFRCWREGRSMDDGALAVSFGHMAGLEPYTQVYAVFTDRSGRAGYDAMMAIARRELADVRHRCVFSVEGAEGIGCDESFLPQAYADGVRAINLCWNRDNALCGSAMDGASGLTEAGRSFVRAMERLGIYADVSHMSDTAFWDLIEMAERPVIASHSNSRTLCPWARNLTDKMFRAVAQTGGCVQVNLPGEGLHPADVIWAGDCKQLPCLAAAERGEQHPVAEAAGLGGNMVAERIAQRCVPLF